MESKGWTAHALAEAMRERGYPASTSAVYEWLRGSRVPNFESLKAIIATLECDPNEFLDESATP